MSVDGRRQPDRRMLPTWLAPRWRLYGIAGPSLTAKELHSTPLARIALTKVDAAIAKARGAEPDHDPPDSRNPYMAKPYDDALIGHLRNNPPRNE